MRRLVGLCAAVVLGLTSAAAFAAAAPSASFTLSNPAQIPGVQLEPGQYTIRVVGQLSDRVILRVDSTSGKVHADFIGIPNLELRKAAQPGVIDWSKPAGDANYLRGWVPPDRSPVIEFVYPKAEAVAIAKENQAKVPAIDPASEGRVADPSLSKEDMQLVTLWLLSSTRVGPEGAAPEIKAERYQKTAVVKAKPVIASLPHTASLMPLVWLVSLMCLLGGAFLRLLRVRLQASGAGVQGPGA